MVKSSNDTAALLCKFCDLKLTFYDDGLGSILGHQPEVNVNSFQCHDVIVLRFHLDVPQNEEWSKNLDFVHQTVSREAINGLGTRLDFFSSAMDFCWERECYDSSYTKAD